jgi:hypothetical protein
MGKLDKNKQLSLEDTADAASEHAIHDKTPTPEQPDQIAPDADKQSEVESPESGKLLSSAKPAKTPKLARLKQFVTSRNFKICFPIFIVVLVAVFAFVPTLKYLVLNLFSSTSVQVVVVDDSSLAAVQGAKVAIGSHSAQTDSKGRTTLYHIPYGTDAYTITKEAYATIHASTTLGTSSNLIGPVKLHSTGVVVIFKAVNTLSKQPLNDFAVRITGSNISAQAGKSGLAVLKVPANKLGKLDFTLSAQGFNDATQTATISATPTNVPIAATITPAGKHYFLSNRSGKVDVYSSNLDGTDPAVVIPGTGAEGSDTTMLVSPDAKHAALVSKRDKETAADGSVEQALYLIDFTQKTIKRLDDGVPNFAVIGWSDNSHIVYSITSGNYQDTSGFKFKLADTSGQLATLFTGQYQPSYGFYREDPNHLYYIVNDSTIENYGINSIDLTTKQSQRLTQTPPDDTILQHTQPYTISFKINGAWSSINTKTQKVQSSSQPTQPAVDYVPSSDGSQFAWTENRDGKQSLIVADQNLSNPHMVTQDPVVSDILIWASKDYITYNSASLNSSADYIVYLPTGAITKISDVFAPSASDNYGGH